MCCLLPVDCCLLVVSVVCVWLCLSCALLAVLYDDAYVLVVVYCQLFCLDKGGGVCYLAFVLVCLFDLCVLHGVYGSLCVVGCSLFVVC